VQSKPAILIVTPYGPETGSGNWRTAERYARLLQGQGIAVEIAVGMPSAHQIAAASGAVVLHARRSHAAAVALQRAQKPYGVVLTGTDLYADLPGLTTPTFLQQAMDTITHARLLVGLQQEACRHMQAGHLQARIPQMPPCRVLLQSATADADRLHRLPRPDRAKDPRLLMVGHVRQEKDPLTGFMAVLTLPAGATLRHLGGSLDDTLMQTLQSLADQDPQRMTLLGHCDVKAVREEMAKADLLLHTSAMEGGALVIAEAFGQGLPVVASRIPGHLGILGDDYPAYFTQGDAEDLARQIMAFVGDNTVANAWHAALVQRALMLCDPGREAQQLVDIVQEILS
jgi:glycosyltransferase involved in cell wall biosynthesis